MHDLSGTDRRNPTVNAYGKLYGAPELSTDEFPILDPKTNTATSHHAPVQDPDTPTTKSTPPTQPSAYWGNEAIWDSKANAHNPMLDEARPRLVHGRRARAGQRARVLPRRRRSSVGEAVPAAALGPATVDVRPEDREVHVRRHVLLDASPAIRRGRERHAVDQRRRPGRRLAELEDVRWRPATREARRAGRRSCSTRTATASATSTSSPNQPADAAKDTRINSAFYAVMPNPADGSIWGSTLGYPGAVVRLNPGSNPPATALAEVFTRADAGLRHRAAPTSTATASSGCRSAAAISARSTGASAKAR